MNLLKYKKRPLPILGIAFAGILFQLVFVETAEAQLTAGTPTPLTQTIVSGTVAQTITVTPATGGNGTYTYQWYEIAPTFGPISGATSLSYSPGTLTVSTYYYLEVTSNGSSATTGTITVTVTPAPPVSGTLSPASQAINYNTASATLTISAASGGNGSYTYAWQDSSASTSGEWQVISGQTGTSFAPGSLTSTIYYRVATTSNGATAYSNKATVTVYPQLAVGSVTPLTQTINYNTVPATITASPTGGNGVYTYQWYEDPPVSGAVSGATAASYSPGALTTTTNYYVQVWSNGVTTTSGTVTVNVNPAPPVSGTLSPASQTINYNTASATLTISAASGGNGSYTYAWQDSSASTGGAWVTISGQTGTSFAPGSLTSTMYYRVATTSNGVTVYSNKATVAVYPQLAVGSVTPLTQTINYNTVPATITASPTGGNGVYTYQWYEISPVSGAVSGATGASYSPGALTTTTNYYVQVWSNGVTTTSGTITVNVYPQLVSGTVSPATQILNYNTTPTSLTATAATGGSGTYTYQWQDSSAATGGAWVNISGATALAYSPSALTGTTYYRIVSTSNGVMVYSSKASVTVYPQLLTGTINPSSQTINYNKVPGVLSISGTTGGNGSYSYQWESAPASGGPYTPISGVTGSSYAPGGMVSTTWYKVVTTSNGVPVTSAAAVVNVNPQVIPGVITPSNLLINSGTSPGLLTCSPASGGACGGAFTYQWQSGPDNATWTNISGVTGLTYSPGNLSATIYYRIQVTCGTDVEYSASAEIEVGTVPTNLNYIRMRMLSKPGVLDTVTADGLASPYDVQQQTTYYDGLAREIQLIGMQASPLQNDMVTIRTYDPFNREVIHYLPYTSPSNNGNYKAAAMAEQTAFDATQFPTEQFYYGQTGYESSPLKRVLSEFSPGNNWEGSGRNVAHQYQVNIATDSVQIWNIALVPGSMPVDGGAYAVGELRKNVTVDERGNEMIEFKNNEDKVILKRVQVASNPGPGHVGWLNTYYVYDNLQNLRYVIQPQAVALIDGIWTISQSLANELCFRYEYDGRNRVSLKKVPGAGIVYMVYDARDRLVMTQDSNLVAQGKWQVTVYDSLDRPIQTGLLTNSNNQAYHQNLAYNSIIYPNTGSNFELLTQTYHDDYSWVSGSGTGLPTAMATNYLSNSNDFITTYNSGPTYAIQQTYFPVTRGMITGTRREVLGSNGSQYVADVNFYDDRSRVIQTQSLNYTGGIDTVTNQYDFTSRTLRIMRSHAKLQNTPQYHTVVTKMDYDQSFRVRHIWKNIDGAAADQLIDSMQYNELGQLNAKYLGNRVDSLVYTYNIRSWLTGINPNYIAGTTNHYFGMELGYDKTTSVAPGNSYITPQYNGNIGGTVWKTAGSGLNRKYDFTYDPVNRITGAAFLQNTSGTSWDKNQVDFSVSNLSYDANGNIMTMDQNGFLVGGSQAIDVLSYSYLSGGSNKLMGVTDAANNPTSQLGDFHYNSSTKQSTDYNYDGDGNVTKDNNKAITAIGYNFLSLPTLIHLQGKGNVSFIYDASGEKLAKITVDTMSQHSVRTLYLDDMVYQQTGAMGSPGAATDTLQFISHEEGRVRWAYRSYTNGAKAYAYAYDFFERDHLGDTRMILTQERDTTKYIATMEAAYRTTESQLFGNIASTSVAFTSMPNYQNIPSATRYGYTNPNDSVSKVDYNGTSGQTTGPSLLLKVMAGDTITPGVQCYYASNTITTNNSSFSSVLNSLASGIMGTPTGAAEGTLSGYTASGSPVYAGLNSFLGTKDPAPPSGYPKAYLNWILLDDQFNYVSSSSGSVATASATYPAGQMNTVAPGGPIVMARNGYFYVWVSNETQGWDVFFDNFAVQYKQGPVLEENHYYPFGLTMAGISDKAVKTNYSENKYRWNKGSELQNKEFSDGSGLEMYGTNLRELDPQLGRWWQLDSKPDTSMSPYASMGNAPILHNDPNGDTLVFAENASNEFKLAVLQTILNMVSRGGGQNIANLAASTSNVNIQESTGFDENSGDHFNRATNTIFWNPHEAIFTTNASFMSAATCLEHEADHAMAYLTDPRAYMKRVHTPDANYNNAEEARVVKGSEQVTARALGEATEHHPTRTDHSGLAILKTDSPFSTSRGEIMKMVPNF